jgi:tellurite resistance protein TerB
MKKRNSDANALTAELRPFLKALASETRQQILLIFASEQPLTVSEISQRLKLSISTTSEQLAILKAARMVIATRDGKEVVYEVDRECVMCCVETLGELMRHCCRPRS